MDLSSNSKLVLLSLFSIDILLFFVVLLLNEFVLGLELSLLPLPFDFVGEFSVRSIPVS